MAATNMATIAATLLAASLFPFSAHGLAWGLLEPTQVAIQDLAVSGISPAPTAAAIPLELIKRQAQSSTICGYLSGTYSKPLIESLVKQAFVLIADR